MVIWYVKMAISSKEATRYTTTGIASFGIVLKRLVIPSALWVARHTIKVIASFGIVLRRLASE